MGELPRLRHEERLGAGLWCVEHETTCARYGERRWAAVHRGQRGDSGEQLLLELHRRVVGELLLGNGRTGLGTRADTVGQSGRKVVPPTHRFRYGVTALPREKGNTFGEPVHQDGERAASDPMPHRITPGSARSRRSRPR